MPTQLNDEGIRRSLLRAHRVLTRNLQNPANKRNILCDAKLKTVLGKPEVTMFELT